MSRFDTLMSQFSSEVFIVEPNFASELLLDFKAYKNGATNHTAIANDSVTYQVIGKNAIIALDGVMYKKQIGICSSVVSYNNIIAKIDEAELDANVENIIFRVDTRGGSVAGAEEVRDRINNSPKHTITFFENVGASGGMWIFTASNEVYSAPMTQLGSIGVIIMYQDKESDIKAIVSSNAPNKFCDISNPECKKRIQSNLNEYESKFLSVLIEAYPEKSSEQIVKDFDNGATIFSETAYKLGYLNGVMQFKELLTQKTDTLASMPSTEEKIVINDMKGIDMADKTDVTIESLQAELATKNTTIEALQADVDGGKEKLAEATAENSTLKDAVAKAEYKVEVATHAVAMGMERGASKEVILDAMKAEDKLMASDEIADAIATRGVTVVGETQVNQQALDEEKEIAEAKAEADRYNKHKGAR